VPTNFFLKRDTFTVFLIPLQLFPPALVSARLYLATYFFISFHDCAAFFSARYFHSPFSLAPPFSLSSRDYKIFFFRKLAAASLSLVIAVCFFSSIDMTLLLFFLVSETRHPPRVVPLEGAFRDSRHSRLPASWKATR
jgi:hypothetical protein